jgi:hypothetical protein
VVTDFCSHLPVQVSSAGRLMVRLDVRPEFPGASEIHLRFRIVAGHVFEQEIHRTGPAVHL